MKRDVFEWDLDLVGEESAHDLVKDAWERGLPFDHYADLLVAHYSQAHGGDVLGGLRERIITAMTREAATLGAEATPPA